jgi:hypothetical protein
LVCAMTLALQIRAQLPGATINRILSLFSETQPQTHIIPTEN